MERTSKCRQPSGTLLPLCERPHPQKRAPHWALLPFVVGVLIGLFVSTVVLVRPQTTSISVYVSVSEEPEPRRDYRKLLDELQHGRRSGGVATLRDEVGSQGAVFYAVVLRDRHSAAQLEAIRTTWAKDIPQQSIAFFIPSEEGGQGGEGAKEEEDEEAHYGEIELPEALSSLAVLELPPGAGAAELHALRHVCQHKINSTKWFFVANGDVYVKTRSLEGHLEPLEGLAQFGYLGKPVRRDPSGRLCLPGPGFVLSRAVLADLCPRLQRCIAMVRADMFKSECVMGECLASQLGVQCYKSSQPQELFLKFDPVKRGSITEPGHAELLATALTVHPITEPRIMQRVHRRILQQRLNSTQQQLRRLRAAADRMVQLMPLSAQPGAMELTSKDDVSPWVLVRRNLVMSEEGSNPAVVLAQTWRNEVQGLAAKAVEHLNAMMDEEEREEGEEEEEEREELVPRQVRNAYWKLDLDAGAIRYVIDFEAVPKSKVADYLEQPKRFKAAFLRWLSPPEVSPVRPVVADTAVNTVIVLSSDQFPQFQNFVKKFEAVLEHSRRVNLVVVVMRATSERWKLSKASPGMDPKTILSLFANKYPLATFKVIDSPDSLSRSHGIALAVQETLPSEILFLADAYLEIDAGFIERCRNLPLRGQQVFFPVPFTRSDPGGFLAANHTLLDGTISSHTGYWLDQSVGVACMYGSDVLSALSEAAPKGMAHAATTRAVFDRAVEKGYQVVRMPDWSLQRTYANRSCDLDLVGERSGQCGEGLENHDSLHLRTQLSHLFFAHKGEGEASKF